MITDDQAEADLDCLVDTDEKAAELKVDVERQSYILKRKEAACFMSCSGGAEQRKAEAKTMLEVTEQEDKYLTAYLASEKINNLRKTLSLRLDVYRTQSANRRQG